MRRFFVVNAIWWPIADMPDWSDTATVRRPDTLAALSTACGLREGDEIVALDGRAVGVNGLDAAWHALQAPDRHHQLKIRRGAAALSLPFLTKPILR